ncbi:MAG: hypothetical protein ACLR23_04900 [Clostridia bacterium]
MEEGKIVAQGIRRKVREGHGGTAVGGRQISLWNAGRLKRWSKRWWKYHSD